jgi:GAF domain-containing protein
MDLIPESAQAVDWYGPLLLNDEDVADRLRTLGQQVQELVPECVAMSLSLIEQGVTLTIASSGHHASLLDGVQYADDGPCLRAMDRDEILAWANVTEGGAGDAEERWHAFAVASAAVGVASSLSLPVLSEGRVVGGFNLYASTLDAFDRHHDELADLLGAWSEGATTNADLGFATRELARHAPQVLHASVQLSVAAGILARIVGCDPEEAVARLRRAAVQATVPLEELVDNVIAAFPRDNTA